jgi:hypothetical protein
VSPVFEIFIAVLQLMAIVLLIKLIEKPGWAIRAVSKIVIGVVLLLVGLVGIVGLVKWYRSRRSS